MSAVATTPPLLRLDEITLRFGGVVAINRIGFDLHEGELLSIIGPNGAGKSSLLNVISGVYRPQHGRISFAGRVLERVQPARMAALGIARTFQNLALFKGMSVLDNVIAGLREPTPGFLEQLLALPAARRFAAEQQDRAEALLEFLGLQRWRERAVGTLPYGLQKRVELARAMAAQPRVLLLDEPMAGMNTHDKHDMARVIVELNRQFGTAVVLIEHDMGVVMDVSDRVVVLDYGRKIADDTPAAVQRNADVIGAYLGSAGADAPVAH
ncbi:MAG TPA: ABC transporter ATP-binding protein [Rhodocyclaceae bacterium]|nr:ABC transporter ATP-binding protein [Rhodocyclaceae bacterium]